MKSYGKYLALLGVAAVLASIGFCMTETNHTKAQAVALRKDIQRQREAINTVAEYAIYSTPITDLPEDSKGWYVTVFTSDNMTQKEREVLSWFDRVPELRRLKAQTHFNHYTPKNAVYTRYGNLTDAGTPTVSVQNADGQVLYKMPGKAMPNEPWPLVEGMRKMLHQRFPHICPGPCPKPEPAPSPDQPDDLPPIPDIVGPDQPDAVKQDHDDSLWIAGVVFALTLVVGFVFVWGKSPYRMIG